MRSVRAFYVASFTDAWIETKRHNHLRMNNQVASFTDAWIETSKKIVGLQRKKSHLLQMRGLKLFISVPEKMRFVASFTDAWIETYFRSREQYLKTVASFTDAWIETVYNTTDKAIKVCRIFYRCVD